MNSRIAGLRTAGALFGLMAVAQLSRLPIRPDVVVSGYEVPLWPSALAFIVLCMLSAWMWKLSRPPRGGDVSQSP